jgi:hypothetical protein
MTAVPSLDPARFLLEQLFRRGGWPPSMPRTPSSPIRSSAIMTRRTTSTHRRLAPHRSGRGRQGSAGHPRSRDSDDGDGPVRAPVLRGAVARDGAHAAHPDDANATGDRPGTTRPTRDGCLTATRHCPPSSRHRSTWPSSASPTRRVLGCRPPTADHARRSRPMDSASPLPRVRAQPPRERVCGSTTLKRPDPIGTLPSQR